MMSQLFGFVMANICIVISTPRPTYGISMLAISAIVASISSIFIRENIRALDKKEESIRESMRMSKASIGALIIEGAKVSFGSKELRPELDDSPDLVGDDIPMMVSYDTTA